ncbi:MAG: hypothetical protein ACTS42_01070, partial [Candidatus Hodgkinia cicadicola]
TSNTAVSSGSLRLAFAKLRQCRRWGSEIVPPELVVIIILPFEWDGRRHGSLLVINLFGQ